jgi:hypothetical protein
MGFVGRLGGGGFKKNISAHYNSYICEHNIYSLRIDIAKKTNN